LPSRNRTARVTCSNTPTCRHTGRQAAISST
jgi:hypothetical protein